MRILILLLGFCSVTAWAGTFEEYEWRVGFILGSEAYQPTLNISYTYKADGAYGADVALPRDANLNVFKMKMKVDGNKVEPLEAKAQTYWSNGAEVAVYMPPAGGKKLVVEAIYVIANIFVIPAAPTALSESCKKLDVGFAPVAGFQFGGTFVGEAHKFNRTRLASRPGEPGYVYGFKLKNVKPATTPSVFFVKPKLFQFSFNNLVGVDGQLSGNVDADNRAGTDTTSINSNFKPYNMVFYREDAARDWRYVPTWIQQDMIYLPFGIEVGGRTKTHAMFLGASDSQEDLLSWRKTLDEEGFFDDFPSDMDMEMDGIFKTVESFRQKFRAAIKVDPALSRLVVSEGKEGMSPAQANLMLASEIQRQLKVRALPAFVTGHDVKLMGLLPVAGFSAVLTAFQVKGDWFFLDAADEGWTLKNSFEKVTGKNILILDGGNLRAVSF